MWHYRMADPEFGDWLANDLVANLEQMLADSQVKPVKGQRNVEVKLVWANKSQVCSRFILSDNHPDFILAAGDDATDEDLFRQLPSSAWTRMSMLARVSSTMRMRLSDRSFTAHS